MDLSSSKANSGLKYNRTKNIVYAGIVIFAASMLSAIIGEVSLRALGYAGAPHSIISNLMPVEDPVLNWRFIPNSTVQDGNIVYRYNSRGFRDVEHTLKKPSSTTRIVVIGDSVTEGSGVFAEEMFTAKVQSLLGSSQYEVINLGMSGLNTPQEAHLLSVEGLQYEPDVVVVNFILNDCDFYSDLRGASKFQAEKDQTIGLLGGLQVDPRLKKLLKSSALLYFVKARVEYLLGLLSGGDQGNYFERLWRSGDCHERIVSGFEALRALQSLHGFAVHLVLWPLLVNYENYEFAHVHQWVTREATKRGFQVLDLEPIYSSTPYRSLQVTAEDNVHPNGKGHEIAAQAYADWFSKISSGMRTGSIQR